MKTSTAIAGLLACTAAAVADAVPTTVTMGGSGHGSGGSALIPIDPTIFTVQSSLGIATWQGNSLTLDLEMGGPLYGGFTQTALLPTSALPAGIVGISFAISSSLSNPRISFGYNVTDASGYGQGGVDLINYQSSTEWDLTTWTRLTSGLGGPEQVFVPLGPNYSPLSLTGTQNPLSSYALLSLDFRADGWNGADYLPGTVSFQNIRWIIAPATSVPEPATLSLLGAGLLAMFVRRRRQAG